MLVAIGVVAHNGAVSSPGTMTGSPGPREAPPMTARRSGAFDPRLLRWARSTRRFLALSVGVGALTAALVITQAWLLADVVAGAVAHRHGLDQLLAPMGALAAIIVARATVGWSAERAASRASAAAKSQLRMAMARHLARLGPAGLERRRPGALVTVATSGIDALDGYFSRYLPQVFLAVLVPVSVVVVVGGADWLSALIVAVTVPLIPLFMVLIGATTRQRTERKMRTLHRLAGHFLDVVAGLPTLKVFGRAKVQAETIRQITGRYRETTMATLKVAFLSSLALELLATLSVALVAVEVGLRLMGGHLGLQTALFVLVLAPEAYLPLRSLGTNYHASAEGMRAAEAVFEVLDQPVAPSGAVRPQPGRPSIVVQDLTVTYPGRRPPALGPLSLRIDPEEVVAITGSSGSGKSTLLGVLLGLVPVSGGAVTLGGVALEDIDWEAWRGQLAWVPQRPHLFATTIAENVRLGRPEATEAQVLEACEAAGLEPVLQRLPLGLATLQGEGGIGLSAGERQRVALARAFLRDAPLLVLDEPTAGLDAATEAQVLEAVRRLAVGRTAVVVAHRPALVGFADRVVHLGEEMVATL